MNENKEILEDNLDYIDPHFLVDEDKFNKLESFFIVLGVVFNDLKGLIFFEDMVIATYKNPGFEEITAQAGNYAGMMVQINKLFAGIISEFFIFLGEYKNIFNTQEFKDILEKISKTDKNYWSEIVAVIDGKHPGSNSLRTTIFEIRNNAAFHFDHSGKFSRNGYASHFFGKNKDDKSSRAYYSIGEGIRSTRFYFSDAAVEAAIKIAAGMEPKGDVANDPAFNRYKAQIREVIDVTARVTASLLKQYIKARRIRS